MSDITRQETIDYLYYLKTHYPKNLIIPEYIDFAISSLETDEAYQLEYESTTKNDKIDCQHTDCNNCVNHKYCDYESTPKNDLGVDAIARADARNLVVKIGTKDILGMSGKAFQDLYKGIDNLPSVTPQEPKTGHWIDRDVYDADRWKCSECGRTEQYQENFCPNCGADMRGIEHE